MLSFADYRMRFPVLNEVSEKTFKHIVDRVEGIDPKKLPLNYIFGDKLRVAIPLNTDEIHKLTAALADNGFEVDYAKGMASRTIQTERGPKKQPMRIGRAIELLIRMKQIDKKWWDYWNQESGNIMKQAKENPRFVESMSPEYSIVISRSPVDLLRMSDFGNIQSCHSEGGTYFNCAIQEAMDGGAIAYVVDTADLKKVKDLQANEVFADPERRVEGITPQSRMRVRLFVNKADNTQLGIPEKRTYGTNMPGFREAVRDFMKKKMEPVFGDSRPRMKDFLLRGGSYHDNPASVLFNDFFGDNLDTGDVGRQAGKDEEDAIEAYNDNLRNEMEEIDRTHNRGFVNPVGVYYNEADEPLEDGHIEFYWQAGVRFSFPARNWDHEAFERIRGWELAKEFNRRSTDGSFEDIQVADQNARREIKHWDYNVRTADGNYKTWTVPNPDYGKGDVRMDCDVRDDSSPGHPDQYREFIEYVKETFDDHYKESYALIRGILLEKKVLKPSAPDRLVNIVQKERFKNFAFEEDPYEEADVSLQSEAIPIFNMEQLKWGIKNWPKPPYALAKDPQQFTLGRSSKFGYWPGMTAQQKFQLVQQAAMAKLRQWWGRVRSGYEQQKWFPGFGKPPFRERMRKMTEPQLTFDWGGSNYETLKVTVSFPFSWDFSPAHVASALRGIHFIDDNFERFINDIRAAVSEAFEKEVNRYAAEERQKSQVSGQPGPVTKPPISGANA